MKFSGRSSGVAGLGCLLALVCACGRQHAPVRPVGSPIPIAVSAKLDLEPLDLSPDGEARLLVRVHYRDAAGRRVHVPPGGHVDVHASRGSVQWQPRARFGDPAAIVRLTLAGPLAVRVTSDLPHLPPMMRAETDTRSWHLAPVTARALGPHSVSIGWFPRVEAGVVRVERAGAQAGESAWRTIALVAAPASSARDLTVEPGARARYRIVRPDGASVELLVDVPPEGAPQTIDVVRGKKMWLSLDDVSHRDGEALLARASEAGIRAIEMRLAYGEYFLITPEQKVAIDGFIDTAARHRIAIIGWTVPRAVSYEDLAANVAVARYRTPAGNGIAGLAVDLERGSEFLAAGPAGLELAVYVERLRAALGRHALLIATVEDPYLEQLPDDAIPYATIATQADVLQPMTYWRMRGAGASVAGMQTVLAQSFCRLRRLAGPAIPIDIGGQTANLGNRYGAPPPAEVAASIATAQRIGAIGETLFDWDATTAEQWSAIAQVAWPAVSTADRPQTCDVATSVR